MKSTLPNFKRSQHILAALVASGAVFVAGCANMATTATGIGSLGQAATVEGSLHGGNQPVAFATVNLWYAGQNGAAIVGATTATANDGFGSFHFIKDSTNGDTTSGNTFSCPSSDPLVYMVATGGNTINSGTNLVSNSASVFLAPLGDCFAIGTGSAVFPAFIDMTEVTTVATMAALQQYFNPAAESFATDGSGLAKAAMTNAFATIPNLVNLANGTAITSLAIPGGSITAGTGIVGNSITVTATPEAAKINTIANILASCINNAASTASNCTTLFNNAVPPDPTTTARPSATFAAATDVLQAAYYMLTNPTDGSVAHPNNLTNLYGLVSAAGAPFQPSLGTAPTDWTIAISYSSADTCGASTGHLIKSAQGLAIDTFGAVWIANNEAGIGNLTQISATGVPVTCIAVGTGANTGITIDASGGTGSISHVWLADSGASNVYRYKPGTSGTGSDLLAFPTAAAPRAIAADGTGNIYFTSPSNALLYEIPQGGLNATTTAISPVSAATGIGSTPATVFVDSTESVWTTSGSNFVSVTASSTPNVGTGFNTSAVSTLTPTYGLAVTAAASGSNYVYVDSGSTNNSISLYQGSVGSGYSSVTNWPVSGLSTPAAVVSDGAMNVWAVNNLSGVNSIVEVGLAAQALSPAGGFVKTATYLGGGRSLVIDQAGNVWVGLDGANSITEIVGAAVPVYQPYADAILANKFQSIP